MPLSAVSKMTQAIRLFLPERLIPAIKIQAFILSAGVITVQRVFIRKAVKLVLIKETLENCRYTIVKAMLIRRLLHYFTGIAVFACEISALMLD